MARPIVLQEAPKARTTRIPGLDLARAIALFGMVIVNFEISMGALGSGPAWLSALTGSVQGRAAATFVVLAGVGASLGSARMRLSGEAQGRRAARLTLLKRGLFLFLVGTVFLSVWFADILHFYGIWLALGAGLLFVSPRVLAITLIAMLVGSAAFLLSGHFFDHWNLRTLSYRDESALGFLRNTFLDGWHPVVPWFALYVYGMWLGRLDLTNQDLRKKLLIITLVGGALLLGIEKLFAPELWFKFRPAHLLMTTSLPPTPTFIAFGICFATFVITLACNFADRFPRFSAVFIPTGQLALTLYVAHVILGLGSLEAMGRLHDQSLPFSVACAVGFYALAVAGSYLWRKRFARGPLEAIMRKVA